MHPDPFARLTHDSAMGNLLFGSRINETPGTTQSERKLTPMERSDVPQYEKDSAAVRYITKKNIKLHSFTRSESIATSFGCYFFDAAGS